MMGGFEDGERYRGQQTQLPFIEETDLSIRDQSEVKISAVPPQTSAPTKPPLPVRIHFMKGPYVQEHLYFRCQGYLPYGGDPNYQDKFGYHTHSEDCARCHIVIDGVEYKPDFDCRRDNHGSQFHIYHSLFNPNPLDHVDPHERKTIAAGLKWLWQDEGIKHVKRTKKSK